MLIKESTFSKTIGEEFRLYFISIYFMEHIWIAACGFQKCLKKSFQYDTFQWLL